MSKRKAQSWPRTDTGNAELIAALYGKRLRYDHAQGRWLIWSERRRRWSEDKTNEVRKFAIAAARHRRRAAARSAEAETGKKAMLWSYGSEHRYRVDAALDLARSLSPISDPGDGWDADPWLFGVANGVLNLKTGRLREERPDDRITKHSPVYFYPTAKCPRFERFLSEIFADDSELVDYIQRMVGYCLTGLVSEQCFFCWYGSGANGKTTLAGVLRYIFGGYAVNLPFSALEMKNRNSNDMVALAGARLATAAETNEGVRLNEARIKMLTGGDPVTGRRLYHENFTFEPTHKLILAFNHKPIIADDSEGMWRRPHLIPFVQEFKDEEKEKDLPETLKAEASGILAWAVRGCLLWQENGMREPPAVVKATANYRAESDHLGEFVEDCCAVESGATVASGVLWQEYQRWTVVNKEVPLSRQTFSQRLEKRGFRCDRCGHGGTRTWVGLRLADTATPSDGVMVSQNDPVSDIFLTSERIEKFSKSGSKRDTTTPLVS